MKSEFDSPHRNQIGIDEAGRGPLFGRVYAAAVSLGDRFDALQVADSKTITSTKKMKIAEEYIKQHSKWNVAWADAAEIDKLNILNATMKCMRDAASSKSPA